MPCAPDLGSRCAFARQPEFSFESRIRVSFGRSVRLAIAGGVLRRESDSSQSKGFGLRREMNRSPDEDALDLETVVEDDDVGGTADVECA